VPPRGRAMLRRAGSAGSDVRPAACCLLTPLALAAEVLFLPFPLGQF
jgi:hypothetical protein